MAGTYPIARGVRLEVEATLAAAKTVSAITAASPAAVTSTSHGLSAGAIGYFSGVSGMVNLEGQAASVQGVSTNAFNAEGINSTSFPAFSGTCSFTPVSTWSTLGNATQYSIGGGDANDVDQTVLIDDIQQLTPGILSAQTVQITGLSAAQTAGMLKCAQAAFDQTALVFRVTLKDGQRRVFRGIPALPSEDGSVGQSISGAFSVRVIGRVLFLPVAS